MAKRKGYRIVIGFAWPCLLGCIVALALSAAVMGAVPEQRVIRAAGQKALGEGGGTPFHVQSVDPPPNSVGIDLDITLAITTSGTISAGTVTSETWLVHGGFQGRLGGEISMPVPNSARYDPHHGPRPGERLQATASTRILPGTTTRCGVWPWETWMATGTWTWRWATGART